MKLFIFEIFLFYLISRGSCIYTSVVAWSNELHINRINLNGTGLFSILFKGPDDCKISIKLNSSDLVMNQRFYGNNNCASLQLNRHEKHDNRFDLYFNELKFLPELQFKIILYDHINVIFYNSLFITPSNQPSRVRNLECYYNGQNLISSWDRPNRVGGGILEYRVIYYNESSYFNYTMMRCSTNCANYTKIGNGDNYRYEYGTLLDQFTQEFDGNQKSVQFTINKSLLYSANSIHIEAVNEWGFGYSDGKYLSECSKYSSIPTTKHSSTIKTSPSTISRTSSTQIPTFSETPSTSLIKVKYSPISNVPDQVNVTLDLVVQEARGDEQKKKLTRPQQYLVMLTDKRDSAGQCILWIIICGCQTQSSLNNTVNVTSTGQESLSNKMRGGCNQSKILMLKSSSTQYSYCPTLPKLSTIVSLNCNASESVSIEIRSQIYNGFTYSKETTEIFNISSVTTVN